MQAFSTDLSLMWEGKEAKSFDVAMGHTLSMPFHHSYYSWGEHWMQYYIECVENNNYGKEDCAKI